jgi:hypothetical protein
MVLLNEWCSVRGGRDSAFGRDAPLVLVVVLVLVLVLERETRTQRAQRRKATAGRRRLHAAAVQGLTPRPERRAAGLDGQGQAV